MAPLLVLVVVLLSAAALWIYGETENVRAARLLGNVVLLVTVGSVAAVGSGFGATLNTSSAYAERLEPFRAAAVQRLEDGECDRALAELHSMEGDFTYENGFAFRALEESTARLNAVREASASHARGADAPPLAAGGEDE